MTTPIRPSEATLIEVRQALQQIELNRRIAPQHNFTATADPTVTDDESEGYSHGSWWYRTTAGSEGLFLCTDATVGAANWQDLGSSGIIGGAPLGAQYVVLTGNAALTQERVLTAGEGIDLTDAGAGSTITIDGEDATSANKGIASFNSSHFSVSSGAVSLSTPVAIAIGGTNATSFTTSRLVEYDGTKLASVAALTTANVVTAAVALTDNRLIRGDGGGRGVQGSGVTLSDTDALSGITQLTVDTLRLDGDTLTSTVGDLRLLTAGNDNEDIQISAATGAGKTSSIIISCGDTGVSNIGFELGGLVLAQFLPGKLRLWDNIDLNFGTSDDASLRWDAGLTNHSLQLGLGGGVPANTGYFFIVELGDLGHANRQPAGAVPDPVLRIYSSDAATGVNDYIEFYQNRTDAYIDWGTGALKLGSTGSDVDINGTLDVSGNITSGGTVDGITLSAHAARHMPGGADILQVSAADKLLGRSTAGGGDVEEIALTSAGRALIDDANAAAQRTTLGLGDVALLTSPVGIGDGGTGQTAQTAAFDALSPTTTKGDLIVSNATPDNIRLAVGTNDQILTADSAQASGVKWATPTVGDVVGPGSATNNAIVRFDGTTGKLIQNSGVTIDDSGNVANMNSLLLDDLKGLYLGNGFEAQLQFDTTGTNHRLALGLMVNAPANSGYFVICEEADIGGREPSGTSPNPVLRIYSSDLATGANDYLEIYHNQTDAYLDWGTGALKLGSTGSDVDINGTLDVSGNITSGGTVDGVTLSAHSARHMTAGADVLSVLGFYNGTFLESFDAVVTSDGATVTLTVTNAVSGDLTMVFSDGETTFDLSGSDGIKTLTAGSDGSPTKNFVYILKSDKILTVSTSSWPTAEHIRIGFFYVPSAGFVQARGVYINHNMNDHSSDQSTDLGHLSHVTERIRAQSAIYKSGANLVIALSSGGTVVDVSVSSSVVYQMHRHVSSALDTNTGDVLLVVNQNGSPFDDVTNLETLTNDSTGTPVKKYFNWIFWGTANKTGEFAPIMLSLPNGSYVRLDQATSDVSGFDVLTMPAAFNGDSSTGFLISRVTMSLSGGVFAVESTTDLRGSTPQSVAGGGVGGQETQFADNQFLLFDESDATKVLDFQLSGITTANTRTITMADQDIDLTPATGTYPLSTDVLLKDGSVALTGAWAANDDITGLTQLLVDNLRLDGNTLDVTNASGNLILQSASGGNVQIGAVGGGDIFLSSDNVKLTAQLNTDVLLSFISTGGNTGTLTYMEDEDEFRFSSPALAATVAGGAAAGGNLILTSTTHGTKNDIFLGSGGSYVFDEANGRLGLGTAAPAVTLHLEEAGTAAATTTFMQFTNNANNASMTETGTSILFRQAYLGGTVIDLARITAETVGDWTSTASTQDGQIMFRTARDGVMGDKFLIRHAGARVLEGNLQIIRDAAAAKLEIFTSSATASRNSTMTLARARGTFGSETGVVNGDRIGQFRFEGYDGSSYQQRSSVFVEVDGAVDDGTDAVPMEMQFRTGTTSSTDQRFVIDSSGDIRIVTSAARLEFGSANEYIAGTAGSLQFYAASGTGFRFNVNSSAVLDIDTNEIRLYIGASQEGAISWDATDLYLENGISQKLRIGGTTSSLVGRLRIGTLTAPATSAALELSSTAAALLLNRMTTTQRNALTAVNGMCIYNNTTNAFNFYENGAWVSGSGLA